MKFTKKKLLGLAILVFLLVTIPISLYLVRQQQILRSRATGEVSRIEFPGLTGTPPRTTSQNVTLRLIYTPTTGTPPTPTPTSSPTPQPTSTPIPTPTPTPSPSPTPTPTPTPSITPMTVVIMRDGYSNVEQYRQDARTIINAFQRTEPFSGSTSIFNFQVVENRETFGCTSVPYGIPRCMYERGAYIKSTGLSYHRNAAKFIVLVNSDNPGIGVGVTNDLGGDMSIFMNQPPDNISLSQLAIHEFLGHAVSQLYDRYTKPRSSGIRYGIKSNCTDNREGEAFWRDEARVTTVYPRCDHTDLFGPFEATCELPVPPGIPRQYAARNTVMSVNQCAGGIDYFDAVEQAWIRTRILPIYQR